MPRNCPEGSYIETDAMFDPNRPHSPEEADMAMDKLKKRVGDPMVFLRSNDVMHLSAMDFE